MYMRQQQQQEELNFQELMILNYLKSLDKSERTTFKRMALFVGLTERVCKKHVQNLREKNYWIVSEKDHNRLGTWLTEDANEWKRYKERRLRESQNIFESITKM